MNSTSNIFRFNGSDPFDNWKTTKEGKLVGYYPRNSLINLASKNDSGIDDYTIICVINGCVKTIGRSCFRNNERFELIVLYEGIEKIEEYAFYNMKLKHLVIPRSIRSIRKNSFSKDFTLYVSKGSYAEKYAIRNGFKYKYYTED